MTLAAIIASFCLGLIVGGIVVAAVSMDEVYKLRKRCGMEFDGEIYDRSK